MIMRATLVGHSRDGIRITGLRQPIILICAPMNRATLPGRSAPVAELFHGRRHWHTRPAGQARDPWPYILVGIGVVLGLAALIFEGIIGPASAV
ncbi:hypothetical protein KOI35_17410 [Actinoplanes bogorensis]|uniref:Uncharacterized protein n=1 Tax=Paractinoplanes bogorensis TaxID=1610840 RepID=A0ABS5YPC8_9ACTN|nr:hypothetical protein [Actinoplanes bogorensis]MBU2665285.1 hypothetical protein [Actinoplanes bogorensis]